MPQSAKDMTNGGSTLSTSGMNKDVRNVVRQEYGKIAIGASVTAHCHLCVTYHIGKAREMGIDGHAIQEAVAVGHRVEKGSMSAMREFTKVLVDSPGQDAPACCRTKGQEDR
jgi:AhpD family alkylhydroperoxidase